MVLIIVFWRYLSDDSVTFLPQVTKLVYQIAEVSCTNHTDGDTGNSCHGDIVPNMLEKLVAMLVKLTHNKREIAERVSGNRYYNLTISQKSLKLQAVFT